MKNRSVSAFEKVMAKFRKSSKRANKSAAAPPEQAEQNEVIAKVRRSFRRTAVPARGTQAELDDLVELIDLQHARNRDLAQDCVSIESRISKLRSETERLKKETAGFRSETARIHALPENVQLRQLTSDLVAADRNVSLLRGLAVIKGIDPDLNPGEDIPPPSEPDRPPPSEPDRRGKPIITRFPTRVAPSTEQ
jgi:DNA repair exonuclease SbcCD ATPase subunit